MTSPQVSVVKAAAAQLVREQPSGLCLTVADLETVFETIAPACNTPQRMRLYLAKCQALGIHPLSSQLFAWEQQGKLQFVVDHSVFVARARRDGFHLRYGVVYAGDDWGGWDAVNAQPVRHVSATGTNPRGAVVGAWCQALGNGGVKVGQYFEVGELENARNPLWKSNRATMAEKSAVARVCRRLCPDLGGFHTREEHLDIASETRETRVQVLADTRARVKAEASAPTVEATATVVEEPPPAVDADAPQVAAEPTPFPPPEKVEPKPAPAAAKKARGPVKPTDEIVQLARRIRADVELVVKCNVDPVEPEFVYLQLGSPDVTAANVDAFAAHLRELASGHEVKSLRPVEFYGSIAKKSSKWATDLSKA